MTLPTKERPLLSPTASASDESQPTPSALALGAVLLRRPRILILVPLLLLAVAAALSLRKPRLYVAESVFRPHAGESLTTNRFEGIAAQLGIDFTHETGAESPEFYTELLRSRELLKEVALTTFTDRSPGEASERRAPLMDHLRIKAETPAERTVKAVGLLQDRIETNVDLRAGVITLETAMPTPTLAVRVNERLLELLNRFNLERRQSQARAEREFIEARLVEARQQLQREEARLAEWLNSNKRFEAASLQAEQARLQRQVDLRQQVFLTLSTAYEQARIDEVRNTPVLTIIDRPEGFVKMQGRGLIRNSLLAAIVGGIAAASLIFLLEYLRRQRVENPQRRNAIRKVLPKWAIR
jgi:uncharacterized protein involved in exopolysaccharide biosynthesis